MVECHHPHMTAVEPKESGHFDRWTRRLDYSQNLLNDYSRAARGFNENLFADAQAGQEIGGGSGILPGVWEQWQAAA
jgi:hypothetical protein